MAAARLQRWALLLSAYTYDIQYKPTESHSNADGLSRLPLPVIDTREERDEGTSIFNVFQILSVPVTFQAENCTKLLILQQIKLAKI